MGSYTRVWPRDLFNEAKLLKCLGQLTLLAHDGECKLRFDHDTSTYLGFTIEQNPADGAVYCPNFKAYTLDDRRLDLYTPLNSRESYPLLCHDAIGGEEYEVFTDNGKLTEEFQEIIEADPI